MYYIFNVLFFAIWQKARVGHIWHEVRDK